MEKSDDKNLQEQKEQLDLLHARVYAAKAAYFNRAPFEEMAEVTFDDLKAIVEQYIQASYDYQKLKYGSIKVRLSVSKLLRR